MELSPPTSRTALLAVLGPGPVGVGVSSTPWVAVNQRSLLVMLLCGTLGTAATVDLKVQAAEDASGSNASDIEGAEFRQTVKASGDNIRRFMNIDARAINRQDSPFLRMRYVRVVVTVGGAQSNLAVLLQAFDPFYFSEMRIDDTTMEVVTVDMP